MSVINVTMEKYSDTLSPDLIQKRFPLLESSLCTEISKVSEWVGIPKGNTLINENSYIKSFPLVLDGVLKIYRMDESIQPVFKIFSFIIGKCAIISVIRSVKELSYKF
jgi:hypothetical protein